MRCFKCPDCGQENDYVNECPVTLIGSVEYDILGTSWTYKCAKCDITYYDCETERVEKSESN